MTGLLEIEPLVLVLIGIGSISIVMGFVMFGKLNSSSKKTEKKSLLDEDYFENFKTSFENTKTIEGTLEQLEEIYAGSNVMQGRIQKALTFIREDYGDYETALEMINAEDNEGIRNLHKKAISAVVNKNGEQSVYLKNEGSIIEDPKIKEAQEKKVVTYEKNSSDEAEFSFEEIDDSTSESEDSEDEFDLGEGYAAFFESEDFENEESEK